MRSIRHSDVHETLIEKAAYLAYLSPTHLDERCALRILKGAFATVDRGVFGQDAGGPSPELVVAARTHISRRLQRNASEFLDDLLTGQTLRIGKIGATVVEITGGRMRLKDPGLTEMRVLGSVCRDFTGVNGNAIAAKLNELCANDAIAGFVAEAFAHGLSRNPDLPPEIGHALLRDLDDQFIATKRLLAAQPRLTQTEEAFQSALSFGAVRELANHVAAVYHVTAPELRRQLDRANRVMQRAETALYEQRSNEAETTYAICVARLSASPNDFSELSALPASMNAADSVARNPFRHCLEAAIERTLNDVRSRADDPNAAPITVADATILAAAFITTDSAEARERASQCLAILTDGRINPLVSVPLALCNIGYEHIQGSFTADQILAISAHQRRAAGGFRRPADTYEAGTGDEELDALLRGIRIEPGAIKDIYAHSGLAYIQPILQGPSGLLSPGDIKQLAMTPSRTTRLWELLAQTPEGPQALAEMAISEDLQGQAEYGDLAVVAAAFATEAETLKSLGRLIEERIELRTIVMENTHLRLADRLAHTDGTGMELLPQHAKHLAVLDAAHRAFDTATGIAVRENLISDRSPDIIRAELFFRTCGSRLSFTDIDEIMAITDGASLARGGIDHLQPLFDIPTHLPALGLEREIYLNLAVEGDNGAYYVINTEWLSPESEVAQPSL